MIIALVPMAAKPYHAGHDQLVRIASIENDIVKLYVSTSDRARPGEVLIDGDDMQTVWWDFIEPTLPKNVVPDYDNVTSPVSKVFKELEKADLEGSKDTYVIYSDDVDILKFTDEILTKAAPTLVSNGQINCRGIKRSETIEVSGTDLRDHLLFGNVVEFISGLPNKIREHGKEIYDRLINDTVE